MYWEDAVKAYAGAFMYARILADDPDVGKDKALEILFKWCSTIAGGGFAQKKRQIGINEPTLKGWYNLARAFDEQFGMWLEIEKDEPDVLEHRYLNCTMPLTCELSGWDCKEICENVIYPLCDIVTPILSDNIKWEVIEFTTNTQVGCKYRITYRDKDKAPKNVN